MTESPARPASRPLLAQLPTRLILAGTTFPIHQVLHKVRPECSPKLPSGRAIVPGLL